MGRGRQEIGLRGDYNLKSELREFDSVIEAGETVPTIRVRLNAKIIRQPSAVIVAWRTFETRRQSASGSIESVVAAYQDALSDILEKTVAWTLEEANADFRASPPKRPVRSSGISRPARVRGSGEDRLSLDPVSDIGLPAREEPAPKAEPKTAPAVGP